MTPENDLPEPERRYTFAELERACASLAEGIRRTLYVRLLLGTAAALVAGSMGGTGWALVIAILALGVAYVRPIMELGYQSHLIAGGIGILIEDGRRSHAHVTEKTRLRPDSMAGGA